jgi:TniQ
MNRTTSEGRLLAPAKADAAASLRESLLSLFRRTCEHNQLTVIDVVYGMDLPIRRPPGRYRCLITRLHLINAGGSMSQRLAERLETVSFVTGSMDATLARFQATGLPPLLSESYRRWCPHCLDMDCARPHGPYERLLWSIECVEHCPVHDAPLESACPHCGHSRLPVLQGTDISGFCPRCRGWLGVANDRFESISEDQLRYMRWVANSFVDLLAVPLPSGLDARAAVCTALMDLCARHFSGVQAHLGTAIGRNKSVVCTWLTGSGTPGWRSICDISYVFQVPLRALLSGDTVALRQSTLLALPYTMRATAPRKAAHPCDDEAARSFFSAVEAGQYPELVSLKSVARRFGIDQRQLRRRLPSEVLSLASVLSVRREAERRRQEEVRASALSAAAQTVAKDLLLEGRDPTRREIQRRLKALGITHIKWSEAPGVGAQVRRAMAQTPSL